MTCFDKTLTEGRPPPDNWLAPTFQARFTAVLTWLRERNRAGRFGPTADVTHYDPAVGRDDLNHAVVMCAGMNVATDPAFEAVDIPAAVRILRFKIYNCINCRKSAIKKHACKDGTPRNIGCYDEECLEGVASTIESTQERAEQIKTAKERVERFAALLKHEPILLAIMSIACDDPEIVKGVKNFDRVRLSAELHKRGIHLSPEETSLWIEKLRKRAEKNKSNVIKLEVQP